jgi:hypothetical protein
VGTCWHRARASELAAAPPTHDAPAPSSSERARPLAERIGALLRERGGPATARELLDDLTKSGWHTAARDPRSVIAAVVAKDPALVAVSKGVYALSEWPSANPTQAAPAADSRAQSRPKGVERRRLSRRIHEVLRAHGSPMNVGQLLRALAETGWSTKSKRPVAVVSAAVTNDPELTALSRGLYALSAWKPPSRETPSERADAAPARAVRPGLATRIHELLRERGAPMSKREIAESLVRAGWTTKSQTPEQVVSATVAAERAFVSVAPGVYALTEWASNGELPAAPPPEPTIAVRVRRILERRGAPMSFGEIVAALHAEGWTTRSKRPRDTVGSAVRANAEFVVVGRATAALRSSPQGRHDDAADDDVGSGAPASRDDTSSEVEGADAAVGPRTSS